jgi:hypothetical protein
MFSCAEVALRRVSFLIVLGVACTTEPTVDGSATIHGEVLHATGAPWPGATVEIACSAGADTTRVSADSSGTFNLSLDFSNAIRGSQSATTSCRFAAPSLAAPEAAVTQTVTLYRSLAPTESVTLREGST